MKLSKNVVEINMILITKKLVVVGDGCSGKTCLLEILNNTEFVANYVPSTANIFKITVEVNSKQVVLHIFDTNGQEDSERPLSYPNADVALICFSVDLPDLLTNVTQKWVPDLKHFLPNVPFVLVCNQKDLRNDACTIEKLRKTQKPLTSEDGNAIAKQIKAFAYLECSAVTKEGVMEVFETAACAALQGKKKKRGCVLS